MSNITAAGYEDMFCMYGRCLLLFLNDILLVTFGHRVTLQLRAFFANRS